MATYMADAVAMLRHLVGRDPERVADIFDRANEGIDLIEAPPTQIAEVVDTIESGQAEAGVDPAGSGREAVRTLLDGPVEVANLDRSVFFRLDNLYDVYTMHDAILVAAHKSRQTDGILTNDEQIRTYDGDATVWG
ncbi:hypothetical protein RYH80_19570 [Halobaculum sp. MBLA0147]|uniref:hypothetical protein n=1 Tax=Halobaculum sp. MBLA0147 TaxID=3079934 RepID=UPI003524D458